MSGLTSHLESLIWCSLFAAPDGGNVTPRPVGENIELVEILTGGTLYFKVGEEEHKFTRGAIFWHQTGEHTIHRTPPNDPYRCAVFHFKVTHKNRPVPRVTLWHDEFQSLDKFVSECIELFHREALDLEALGAYAYGTLLRHARYRSPEFKGGRDAPRPLLRALEFLRTHLHVPGSIAALAAAANVSEPYLYALFQKHLGKSPHAYWMEQRLDKARVMLAGGLLPIKVVATECGFESIELFYRRFREHCHMPPGAYRKLHTSDR